MRCFLKDLNLTLNYLRAPFPHKHMICTTNLLERFFREFRSCADEIGCFASQDQAESRDFHIAYIMLRKTGCAIWKSRLHLNIFPITGIAVPTPAPLLPLQWQQNCLDCARFYRQRRSRETSEVLLS
ncbi:MAG: hypothetical protein B6I35_01905 [Anaerolineaceae bacterium 4572_32.2]|nr:MAG: hypothetical protein B6I35_01905 [Anaerolineaceae bacterium 4572_32.2]